jgi:hypothetical protein
MLRHSPQMLWGTYSHVIRKLAGVERVDAAEAIREARYFVVEQVFPTTAPDTNAGEAVGTGLLFPGDTVDVVCLRGGSWAKLDDGSWVPEHAVQAEVDAEPAPHC